LHTGYLPNPSVRYPSFGSNVAHQLAESASALPSYVRIGGGFARDGTGGGILGVSFDPFLLNDPNRPPDNTEVRTGAARYQRRLKLAQSLNGRLEKIAEREARDHQKLYERASKMILSTDMTTFDLSQERDAVRASFGESNFGRGCLLARRLVEKGVPFVEVNLGNWDTHQDNFDQTRELCGQLDQPFARLVIDLKQRGLLDDTLVIWMGEFGRTPRINARGGRDHYPQAFNVALAGGGVRGGQVIGTTDPAGATVTDQPVTIPDLFYSFCSALGIDADYEHMTPTGRPVKIVESGSLIPNLFS
jgi:hypothetical protein